ncbi:MAG: cell division protein FtsZ [Candidatus Ancillula sp.]|jgi:cell division protein FtsZ|nr:cell division protein FtsZ [Candidatus Ancillula sp.]
MVDSKNFLATLKVVGVGGAGSNAVNQMVDDGLRGVESVAMNTDEHHLLSIQSDVKVALLSEDSKGLGAGGRPESGKAAAEESAAMIEEALKGADMIFLTAGEGGGTGTGAAPVVARIARDLGILTGAIVTTPFHYEGKRKMKIARQGIAELQKEVDALIEVPNQKLLSIGDKSVSFADALAISDTVLSQSVRAISDIVIKEGKIDVDFRDVCNTLQDKGTMLIGIGEASGPDRAINAVKSAITSPLLESSIDGASDVIICAFGAEENISLNEFAQAADYIEEMVDEDALIKQGLYYDDQYEDTVRFVIVASGFGDDRTPVQGTPIQNQQTYHPDNSQSYGYQTNFPANSAANSSVNSPASVGQYSNSQISTSQLNPNNGGQPVDIANSISSNSNETQNEYQNQSNIAEQASSNLANLEHNAIDKMAARVQESVDNGTLPSEPQNITGPTQVVPTVTNPSLQEGLQEGAPVQKKSKINIFSTSDKNQVIGSNSKVSPISSGQFAIPANLNPISTSLPKTSEPKEKKSGISIPDFLK